MQNMVVGAGRFKGVKGDKGIKVGREVVLGMQGRLSFAVI